MLKATKTVWMLAAAVAGLGFSSGAWAAFTPISYGTAGLPYTEGFDIGTASATVPITTVAGLVSYSSGGGTGTSGTVTTSDGNTINYVYANAQSYDYIRRNTAYASAYTVTITNQRLSTINYDGTTSLGKYNAFGLELTNNTGMTLTSFALSYASYVSTTTNPTGSNDEVAFTYGLNPTDYSDAGTTWTSVAELGFTGGTDGTAATNSNLAPTALVTGIVWNPGDTLALRWKDTNIAGVDHGMGVDNVVFSAVVPEPGVAGLMGVGLAAMARRRR